MSSSDETVSPETRRIITYSGNTTRAYGELHDLLAPEVAPTSLSGVVNSVSEAARIVTIVARLLTAAHDNAVRQNLFDSEAAARTNPARRLLMAAAALGDVRTELSTITSDLYPAARQADLDKRRDDTGEVTLSRETLTKLIEHISDLEETGRILTEPELYTSLKQLRDGNGVRLEDYLADQENRS